MAARPRAAHGFDVRTPARERRVAASSVRELRAGGGVPARGRARPAGAGHQADDLSHGREVRADGSADRGGAARQGSDGGRGVEGALRRGSQHQLGRTPRGRGCAGGLRHRRPEDARQAAAGDAARTFTARPAAASLRASVHGQLQPEDGAPVHRHRLPERRRRHHGRRRPNLPADRQPHAHEAAAPSADGAVRAAQAACWRTSRRWSRPRARASRRASW